MADVEKLRINLKKNEEKLEKKIKLLAKYEAKKEKLENQFLKLSNGTSYLDACKLYENSNENKSKWEFFKNSFGDECSNIMYDLQTFYDTYWSPIAQTKKGIKEIEEMISSYKEKIAKEEKLVSDRNASISANTVSVNGKDVNVIVEFLNEWERKTVTYYLNVFDNYKKNFKNEYKEVVENSFEHKVLYNAWENKDFIESNWSKTEYFEYYSTYEEFKKNDRYSDKCTRLIHDNYNELKEEIYSRFDIKAIEKWGKSIFNAKKEEFEKNMKSAIAKEKDRKYDKLIQDVESIVGQILI